MGAGGCGATLPDRCVDTAREGVAVTEREIVRFLLARGLVDPAHLVAGDLMVLDASRRNHNFQIIDERGACYLTKQGVGPQGVAAVAREAALYQRLHAYRGLERYISRFHGYEAREHLLVLELVRDARDLRAYYARADRFPILIGTALGNALGTVHRVTSAAGRLEELDEAFGGAPPGVLALHRPDAGIFRDASGATLRLIQVAQGSAELCQALDDLRQGWRARALIHGDVKWDNCVVCGRPGSRRMTRVKLVDWELAGVGDPCWDVGAAFSGYLGAWLLSVPFVGEDGIERYLKYARFPLGRMRPTIRAIWRAYARQMRLDAATEDQWLLRATRYAGAGLIHTAFEHTQMSALLEGNVISLLQMGVNILRRPREAMAHLLGLCPRDVGAA